MLQEILHFFWGHSNSSSAVYTFPDDEDPHVITALLKRYFREMQDPLLTHNLYRTFIAAASM